MQVHQRGLVASVLMAALIVSPLAEAKRAGGGKSHGMARSSTPTQSYQQPRQAAPVQQAPVAGTAQQKSGPGVGSMVAAGVAGAAIGAVAANALADNKATDPNSQAATNDQELAAQQAAAQEEKGGMGWLWVILAAAAAFFLFRRFGAKKKLAGNNPYAPNNAAQAPFGAAPNAPNQARTDNTNIFGQNVGGAATGSTVTQAPFGAAYTQSGQALPDGTEPAAFLRVARQRFNHIQAMNSASNIEEIRRYLTPELYQSMYNDIMANQDQDVAEFSNLTAMVAETATENGQYIVSVRFSGQVTEDLNSLPQPFTEIWHFVKPVGATTDWLVAGIQQD